MTPDWKSILHRSLNELETQFESRRVRIDPRTGGVAPVEIVPFRGYGTSERVRLKGRVLGGSRITRAAEDESVWKNLLDHYRRFESDELASAPIRATLGETVVETRTDDEGYFDIEIAPAVPLADTQLWHEVGLELLDPHHRQPVRTLGQVLVPPANAQFGVISDIDDTVIHTDAARLAAMVRNVLLKSARSRLPFEGVAQFYRALQLGHAGLLVNPIFYVSSGPWNLYDLLCDFFEIHEIPAGPILLQDFGLDQKKLIHSAHDDHKLVEIGSILTTYPSLPFVLIGDSGQRDPEIYLQVVKTNRERIRAVYIRDVSAVQRDHGVEAIAQEIIALGVETVVTDSTQKAFDHARKIGLLP